MLIFQILLLQLLISIASAILQNGLENSQVIIIPKSNEQRTLLFIYRYNSQETLDIIVNSKETYKIVNTVWPQYGKITFQIPSKEQTQMFLSGTAAAIQNLDIPSGWVWNVDFKQAFEDVNICFIYQPKGADYFYFQNSIFSYILKNEYFKIYQQLLRPQYHFSAPKNWINDPNGQQFSDGYYHLFYQYDPFNIIVNGVLFWGHSVSKDGIHWKHLPIALFPDQSKLDKNFKSGGIYSGGGLHFNDQFLLYYTDHYQDQSTQTEQQYLTKSNDGITYESPDLIISTGPPEASKDIRDPTVSLDKYTGKYTLQLGTAYNKIPSIIQFVSTTPQGPWVFDQVIYSSDKLHSTTIECPNKLFLTDQATKQEKVVLIFSINDIAIVDSYVLYVIGDEDVNGKLTNIGDPRKLDYGGSFYATESFPQTSSEEALIITWMQNWNQGDKFYGNKDYSGVMTLTRKLWLEQNILHQLPFESVKSLRVGESFMHKSTYDKKLSVLIPQTSEIYLNLPTSINWTIKFLFLNSITQSLELSYDQNTHILKVYAQLLAQESDSAKTYTSLPISNISSGFVDVRIFLDTGSIEYFISNGEITLSQRFFADGNLSDYIELDVEFTSVTFWNIEVWRLGVFY